MKNTVDHFITSPDGRRILKIYSNGTIELADVDYLPGSTKRFTNKGEPIRHFAIEWESLHIIVVYTDQSVKLIDLNHGNIIGDVGV